MPKKTPTKKRTASKKMKTKEKKPEHQGPLQVPLEELHKYKIMAFTGKVETRREKIKLPLVEAKNRELQEELRTALEEDEEYQKARKAQTEAINEAMRMLYKSLPEGYTISKIDTEEGLCETHFDPDSAGKLLDTP